MLKRRDLMPTGDETIGLIEAAAAEGCLDGGTAERGFIGDDGIPATGVRAFVDLLGTIVHQTFVRFDRHF